VNLLAATFGRHEAGLAEDGEVSGNGRPARVESVGNLARSARAIAKQLQDVATCLISQCSKGGI
jgi:hypothetical protein